ncbi:MAG TPA: VOC family protein [Vicinamibacterales bacterium]|jgi:predicted enzyme related to lactoylglutathione lyase|nr:VOC family protein [Vicinamibacterales bacterium]
MNTIGYFEIQADNPERAARFYESVFGWTFTRDPLVPIEYWRAETNNINGAILKRPAALPEPQSGTNAYVCSVQVESFDETATLITRKGGRIAMAKFAVPGKCWQGYFIDPEGNTFGVFEVDEGAR